MQEYIGRPSFQVAFFILLSLVLIPIARPKNADSVWSIAGVVYAVFIGVNSVLFDAVLVCVFARDSSNRTCVHKDYKDAGF
jgi:hypothetical protein